MTMFKDYKTSTELEKKGVTFVMGADNDFRVTLARAGGSNTQFQRVLSNIAKPYKRAISTGTIAPEVEAGLMRRAFIETVVKNWEVKVGEEWRQGIHAEDGSITPFSIQALEDTFKKLPDLFAECQALANDMQHYREEQRTDDAGN